MNGRSDYREGRRLVGADLRREFAAQEADIGRHVELAHHGDDVTPRLVGSTVAHPAGIPRMDLVREGAQRALRLVLDGSRPALELGVHGGHRAAGSVTASAAGVRAEGPVRLLPARVTTLSVPWSVRALDVTDDTGSVVARELRIELLAPAGSPPSQSRMTVGEVVTQQPFRAALSVDAAGNVTIAGDLGVAGAVSQGEIPADPEDPRFLAQLADVVARRVLGAATSTSGSVLQLVVTPDTSSPDTTPIAVGFTPTVALTRWGAALEIRRGGGSRFVLLRIGGPVAAGAAVQGLAADVPWSPPLSTASPGQVVVAVVAYDATGTVHAQRQSTVQMTG